MANEDTLFEDDFSNDSAIVDGDAPQFSGPYAVRLHNPGLAPTRTGGQRVGYTLEIVEDPSGRGQEGCVILSGQNVPSGDKAHISRRFWLSTLESLGHNMTQLRKKFKLTIPMLQGKTGYIVFKTADDNGSEYPEVKWLSKDRYQGAAERIKAQAAAGTLKTSIGVDAEGEPAPAREVTLTDAVSVGTNYNEADLLDI